MGFGDHLAGAEGAFQQVEAIILQIEAGDLRVAAQQERELRTIFDTLQREVEYRELGGVAKVRVSSAQTRAARRKAFAALDRWQAQTLAGLRASPTRFQDFLQGRAVLGEMRQIQNMAVGDWRRIMGRLDDPRKFTPQQVQQAQLLKADTDRLQKKFGGFNNWLEDITGEASYGKAENMIAVTNRAFRDAQLSISRLTRGPGAGGGSPVREAISEPQFESVDEHGQPRAFKVIRAREATASDIADQRQQIRFDRRRLVLSSQAHTRGIYNAAMIRLAAATGVFHFMFYLTKPNRPQAKGTSRQELYQIRRGTPDAGAVRLPDLVRHVAWALARDPDEVEAEARRRTKLSGQDGAPEVRSRLVRMLQEAEPIDSWPKRYQDINTARSRDRRTGRRQVVTFDSTLQIHPGSQEFYLPIPTALLAEARSWSRAARSRFQEAA